MPLIITAMALLWRFAKIFLALFFWPLTLGRLSWSLTQWRLCHICPSRRLPEFLPSASLSSLSDVSLLAIFSHLPVVDLLHALCLSKQMQNLASSAARQRRSLILDDGTWSISYFTYTIPPTNVQPAFIKPSVQFTRLPKVEGSRRGRVPLCEDNPAILRIQKSLASQEFACQSTSNGTLYWQPLMRFYSAFLYWQPLMRFYSAFLPCQPPTTHLATIFPTINRLYISMEGDLNALYTIVRLLKAWGPSLSRLHLRFRLYDPEAYGEATIRHFYTYFLTTMNAAPLRHLHLDMHLGWFFTFQHPNDCHLPLVHQLESLYYRTFTNGIDIFADQPMQELVRHLAPEASVPAQMAPPLRRIAFDNGATLNGLLQMPANLASRLVKVVIGEFSLSYPPIDEDTLPNLTRVCLLLASQREGGSVQEFSLSCSVPLYKIVAAILPLRKLRHLQISTHGLNGHQPELPPQGTALLKMPSVRSLALQHSHLSHAYMERLSLQVHFPELRVVSVVSKAWRCTDCGYKRIREGNLGDQPANFNLQLVRQCEQAEDAYICQTLPNLQALCRTRRNGWYVYEAIPVQYAPWN